MSDQEQAQDEILDLSEVTEVFGTDKQQMKEGVYVDIPGTDDKLKIAFVPNIQFARMVEKELRTYKNKSKLNDKEVTVIDRSYFTLKVTAEKRLVGWSIIRNGVEVPYSEEKSFEMIQASPALDKFVTQKSKELGQYINQTKKADVKKS